MMRIQFWFAVAAMGLLLLGTPAGAEEAGADVSYESLAESGYFAGKEIYHEFSADGRAMVTHSWGDGNDYLGELWKYDDNRAAFFRKPLALPPLGQDQVRKILLLSKDGSIVVSLIGTISAVGRVQAVVFDADQGRVVSSLPVRVADISPDNQTVIVGHGCDVDILSLKTGEKVATLKQSLPAGTFCRDTQYDPTGRFIVSTSSRKIEEDYHNTIHIYDAGSHRLLKEFDGSFSFSPDGSFFAYNNYSNSGVSGKARYNKILDTATWKEIDIPDDMGPNPVFASPGKALDVGWDSMVEYIIRDGRALPVQQKNFSRELGTDKTYVNGADTWYVFSTKGGEVVTTLKTASPEMVQAAVNLAEGEKMLSAGFYAPGISKYREAMTLYPLTPVLRSPKTFIDLYEGGLPMRYVGELLLAHQQKLLQADKRSMAGYGYEKKEGGLTVSSVTEAGPAAKAGLRVGDVIRAVNGNKVVNSDDLSIRDISVGSSITMAVLRDGKELILTMNTVAGFVDWHNPLYAVERLMYYGMFAIHAGHPELAGTAVQKIRSLRQLYPTYNWNNWIKSAVALEALLRAYQGGVDQAYEYLFEQGGLTHAGNKYWANHLTNFPDYWAPLYADRKKLAYLLGVDEKKLPTPGPRQFPSQPYPNLNGKLLEASGTPPGLEKAPPSSAPATPAKDTSRTKGRVLD